LAAALVVASVVLPFASAEDGEQAKVLIAGITGHIDIVSAWLEVDPLTDPRVIPARSQDSPWSGDQIRKFIRIYFPRNYEELIEFEYMVLASIETWVFTNRQLQMLHDSIYEDGLGGVQERSVMSMHDGISLPWAHSVLSDAYPNDADAVVSTDYTLHDASMQVVINTHPDIPPIFKPYKELPGVEYFFGGSYGTNLAIPKPGAVITSFSVGPYEMAYGGAYPDPGFKSPGWIPHSMYWEYGNGTTWTHQDMFSQYWNTLFNPFAPDMILAELLFSTGRDLPSDVIALHRLRVKFTDFGSQKNFIYALLDSIDKFGANTSPIVERMGEIADLNRQARQLYLDQDYQESSATMDRVLADVDSLRQDSLVLKDRALLWVYLVEWLVVSGVLLVTSFALWTLMVRRRLYREVASTRLSGID
jgi:hypothetical protein